ncbi:MAG: hypothetical protein AB7G93_07505 [Bdellovibrionales bacterium]
MKTYLLMSVILGVSTSAFAETCDVGSIGPKLDDTAKITSKCTLEQYRSVTEIYEYRDETRNESGTALVTFGSNSALSDTIQRDTYPGQDWKSVLIEGFQRQGLNQGQIKSILETVRCQKQH